ncbi:HtaA domain-containing protein [Streptomyces triculaminicus]|uniref:HtaA domain-containing protein n=1 Tax=Streptomyces triculaminicus TaxID=2816232 RepID=UPI0037D39CAD
MTATARRAALAALATATALGATALTVPAHAAGTPAQAEGQKADGQKTDAKTADGQKSDAQQPPKTEITDGSLRWGVKESFRKYVVLAKGKIELGDGARQAGKNGDFTFAGGKGTYDPSTHALTTTFKGSVRFLAHPEKENYQLDLKFSDIKVVTDAAAKGAKGSITADVTRGGKTEQDVAIASLDVGAGKMSGGEGGAVTYAKIPAKLTKAGAEVFSFQGSSPYAEGQDVDPATLAVKVGTPQQPKPEDPKPKPEDPKPKPEDPKPDEKPKPGEKPAPGTVLDGNLDWGVKQSFRAYIEKSKGKVELGDGALQKSAGYRFPKGHGKFEASSGAVEAEFNGNVRFTAHDGKLDLKLSGIKVKATGTNGMLTADVASSGTVSKDVPLATLKLTEGSLKAKDGVVALAGVPATLTGQGAKAFAGYYTAGETLDPVTLAVALDANAKLPDGTEFENCEAVSAAGKAPLRKGEPGYSAKLDTDGDGVACEASGSDTATTGGSTTGGSTTGGSTTGGSGSTTDTGSLAQTGSSTPTGPLLGAAGAMLLAGSGAVYATRRRRDTQG